MDKYFDLLQENNGLRLQVLKLENEIDRLRTKMKIAKEWLER